MRVYKHNEFAGYTMQQIAEIMTLNAEDATYTDDRFDMAGKLEGRTMRIKLTRK